MKLGIDRDGFVRLGGFIGPSELAPLADRAERAVAQAADTYSGFVGPAEFTETVWSEIPRSLHFRRLCAGLTGLGLPTDQAAGFYQVFRCLRGRGGESHSLRFHYDSYVLTVLVPVAIPERGASGDLLMFPAKRPIRRSYLRSLLDKAAVDNPLAQRKFLRQSRLPGRVVSLALTPGDAYLFWGYRSLHANEGVDPGALRATALLHYGDPHAGDRLRTLIRRARKLEHA